MEELWTYTVIVMSMLAILAVIYHVILKYSKYGIDTLHLPADVEDIPSDVPDHPFGQCCPPPFNKENLIQADLTGVEMRTIAQFAEDNGLEFQGARTGRFTSSSNAVHQDCSDSKPGDRCPNKKGCEVESFHCQLCPSYKTFRKREGKFEGMSSGDYGVLQSDFYEEGGEIDIKLMQEQNNIWRKHNFPYSRKWHPMAGINEEIGEAALAFIKIVEAAGRLNHGALKKSQGIRVNEDHDAAIKDAIGDIFIYSLDFCNRHDIDMFESIKDAWEHVRQRDWQQNKKDGS